MPSLLIAGGSHDPNLPWLQAGAQRQGIATRLLLVDPTAPPAFSWSLASGVATIDGEPIDCTGAFLRYDVFSGLAEGKAEAGIVAGAWYAAVSGYCATAGLTTFNRSIDPASGSKPAMLELARQAGLPIPPTLVTNAMADLHRLAPDEHIAKPVGGGSYVMELGPALAETGWVADVAPAPAIVQPRLVYPERRVFRVGARYFAFDIGSRTTDSRLDGNCIITCVDDVAEDIMAGIVRLTDSISCDFCAIDLKTDPATGGLVFLELNNGPMFVGYDRSCGGAMAETMALHLMSGVA